MALATDEAGIQFRIPEREQGDRRCARPARAADRVLYRQAIRRAWKTSPI